MNDGPHPPKQSQLRESGGSERMICPRTAVLYPCASIKRWVTPYLSDNSRVYISIEKHLYLFTGWFYSSLLILAVWCLSQTFMF